jgi:uncharacterized phage protein gp47/JayE
MPFQRPTLQQIIDRIEEDFSSRLGSSESFLRRSILKIKSRVYGGAVHLLYGFLDFQADQLFATTAETDELNKIANELGLSRNTSVKATGTGTATGTNGITIPAQSELQSSEGTVYLVDEDITISSGIATLALTAKEFGSSGNDNGGITLTFVSPIANVDTSVVVASAGLINGLDEESDADLRTRILRRKQFPPHGGTLTDLVTWVLEISGNTRAWSFSQYQGNGTAMVTYVRDNDSDSILPTASEVAATKSYLESHVDPASSETVGVPVTMIPGLFVLQPTLLLVNMTIQVNPNTTAIQTAIQNELTAMILRDGGAGLTLRLSRISEAISIADGEFNHVLTLPTADVVATNTQVHVLGTLTFTTLTI